MRFTTAAWDASRPIREAIDSHPFLSGLERGTLPRESFDHYLAQDAVYLRAYARVLAIAASRAVNADDVTFWSEAATNAIAVESQLHSSRGVHVDTVVASPTCTAYTSYLLSLTATASYPVLVAGLLPCFWIYDDVGRRLKRRVGDLSAHAYGDWIGTYGDPAFEAATRRACRIVDVAGQEVGAREREQMLTAFTTASRYEWMFWDAAWLHETWPV